MDNKDNNEVSNEYIASYFDGEYQNEIPGKDDGYVVDKIVCDNGATATWDNDEWGINIRNATEKIKCSIYFKYQFEQDFDYTGTEQVLTIPKTGTYKIELWGAQGGSLGGRNAGVGGYSLGVLKLEAGDKLYLNIGGQGGEGENYINNKNTTTVPGYGGYNGGGSGQAGGYYSAGNYTCAAGSGGGGATHIATVSGLLSTLENSKETILIVAGGGGGISGFASSNAKLGSGGGYIGYSQLGHPSTQTSGFAFGLGGSVKETSSTEGCGGGGGGYYGGQCDALKTGSGGSGYIGNSLLTNKSMYCYNCEESSEEDIKTISTTCAEETPTEKCAKKGNGYARITYIG